MDNAMYFLQMAAYDMFCAEQAGLTLEAYIEWLRTASLETIRFQKDVDYGPKTRTD